MTFRFYQSLRTVPRDLDEVARGFHLTGWQNFWQLEAPFAMPGLIWNTMMSMSGGWFFVVASEAITVGDTDDHAAGRRLLPRAGQRRGTTGTRSAPRSLTMAVVILLYDQLLFRPLVAWADKFRVELSVGPGGASAPGCSTCCGAPAGSDCAVRPVFAALRAVDLLASAPAAVLSRRGALDAARGARASLDVVWIVVVVAIAALCAVARRRLCRHGARLARRRPTCSC